MSESNPLDPSLEHAEIHQMGLHPADLILVAYGQAAPEIAEKVSRYIDANPESRIARRMKRYNDLIEEMQPQTTEPPQTPEPRVQAPAPASPPAPIAVEPRRWPFEIIAAVAVLLLLLVGVGLWVWVGNGQPDHRPPANDRIERYDGTWAAFGSPKQRKHAGNGKEPVVILGRKEKLSFKKAHHQPGRYQWLLRINEATRVVAVARDGKPFDYELKQGSDKSELEGGLGFLMILTADEVPEGLPTVVDPKQPYLIENLFDHRRMVDLYEDSPDKLMSALREILDRAYGRNKCSFVLHVYQNVPNED
jgi:hypothetical protein